MNLKKVMVVSSLFLVANTAYADSLFKDVNETSPYYSAISNAVSNGFMTTTDGNFRPDEVVTRAQLALILDRYKVAKQSSGSIAEAVANSMPKVVKINTSIFKTTDISPGITMRTESVNTGTGIFVDASYIVTCFHVVDSKEDITVTNAASEVLKASVVAVDKLNDLALLKVDSSSPKYFETTHRNVLGELAVAIGNPSITIADQNYPLDYTVTQGVISATDRVMDMVDGPRYWVQIDTTVNPGNSGGPVINDSGQLIGIVSASAIKATGIAMIVPNWIIKRFVDKNKP